MQILPVTADNDRRFQVLLGDNLLTLRTYFNSVVPGWFMDIVAQDETPFARGLALVPAINILRANAELTRTLGQFRVIVSDGGENDTPESLGNTAQLWWFAPGEFETLDQDTVVDYTLPFDVRAMYRV